MKGSGARLAEASRGGEWQTRRSQKPLIVIGREGSTPSSPTKLGK